MVIYKVTNIRNGMVYIGQTKRSLKARWKQHCQQSKSRFFSHKLQNAIHDFGPDSFTIEQIDTAETQEEAYEKEIFWIKHYDSKDGGYNGSLGGKGGGHYKKVKAVESGLEFDTIKEAAKYYGVSFQGISAVVDKPKQKSAGQHWVSI